MNAQTYDESIIIILIKPSRSPTSHFIGYGAAGTDYRGLGIFIIDPYLLEIQKRA